MQPAQPAGPAAASGSVAPPALDDDEDVVDAEIVEADALPVLSTGAWPAGAAPDYSEAGVPSLDYLRDKIEGRYATAQGSAELAGAGAREERARELQQRAEQEQRAAATAQEQRIARERAATDRLAQIRRSLHPES